MCFNEEQWKNTNKDLTKKALKNGVREICNCNDYTYCNCNCNGSMYGKFMINIYEKTEKENRNRRYT